MIKRKLKPFHFIEPEKKKPIFRSPGVYTREHDITVVPAYEPMRRNRYLLTIPNPSNGQMGQFFVRLDSMPHIQRGGFDVHTLTRTRMEWNPITIKIMDTVGPTTPEFFRDWMLSYTEATITGRMGYANNYKRDIQLESLDPTGVVLEKWVLTGAQIQEMRHEIVYDQTVGDIEIRIIFDNATLTI